MGVQFGSEKVFVLNTYRHWKRPGEEDEDLTDIIAALDEGESVSFPEELDPPVTFYKLDGVTKYEFMEDDADEPEATKLTSEALQDFNEQFLEWMRNQPASRHNAIFSYEDL